MDKKEYIEREALLERLCGDDPSRMEDYYYNAIKDVPAADVAPVVHGEWLEGAEHFTNGFYDAECNKCRTYISWNEGNSGDWNYCPNCGAKMDGGEK